MKALKFLIVAAVVGFASQVIAASATTGTVTGLYVEVERDLMVEQSQAGAYPDKQVFFEVEVHGNKVLVPQGEIKVQTGDKVEMVMGEPRHSRNISGVLPAKTRIISVTRPPQFAELAKPIPAYLQR